jgi:hypothetical protein
MVGVLANLECGCPFVLDFSRTHTSELTRMGGKYLHHHGNCRTCSKDYRNVPVISSTRVTNIFHSLNKENIKYLG